jgi:antitoxin component YwqK of YwqJK toxin-antitoxin module
MKQESFGPNRNFDERIVLQGITKTFYKTGELQGDWNYIDGSPAGNFQERIISSGNVEVERKFVDGRQHGTTRIFHDHKDRIALEAFFIDDKLQGNVKIFDLGGKVRVLDEYINDELLNRVRFDFMGKLESVEKVERDYYPE